MAIRTPKTTTAYTLLVRGGVTVDSRGKAAGKGALIAREVFPTIDTLPAFYPVIFRSTNPDVPVSAVRIVCASKMARGR